MPERPLEELKEEVGTSKVTAEGLTIEAGKVEEFARAVKDDNPVHRSESAATEQGFEAVPAPMTFLLTSAFPRYRPEDVPRQTSKQFDLGFDSRYSVHGEQEFEFERPVRVGDTLTGTTTLTDVYQREGDRGGTMTFAVFETEFRTQDDELVATTRATGIEIEQAPDSEGGSDE
jgi:acyl dehydratase